MAYLEPQPPGANPFRVVGSAGKFQGQRRRESDVNGSVLSVAKNVAKMVFSPLATHLPDAVVKCDHGAPLPFMSTFQAGVLFLDISG